MTKPGREETTEFKPLFNEGGLIPCIATSAQDGRVLMFAWMDEEALRLTMETGEAHYWSRSRGELWRKGATSGHVQTIKEMRVDCDHDCLWISVESGPACHTGRQSCFYRVVGKDGRLIFNQ
ncbi:MAG: phosphoribosyl-AMP cyclohydrolase [Alphaproteobacteria bacterium]